MKRAYLILFVVIFTLVLWLPFVAKIKLPGWGMDFSEGTRILWQNYDGPNYLIVEKTWYNKQQIREEFSSPLPTEYYPAHFPMYPAIIWVFNNVFRGPTAMLLATLTGTVLCFWMFHKYLAEFKITKHAFWLSLVFLFLPARWVAIRAVGSPEPWFIFFILASLFFYRKQKYWYAGLLGILAQLTKSPAILLLGAYGIDFLINSWKSKRIRFEILPVLLQAAIIPVLFWFYGVRTGDFWAYFNSGDNIHLFWPPFSVFAPKGQVWVGNFWLEDVIWTWLVFGIGILKLTKKKLHVEQYFAGLFFVSTLFVAHRDISRYLLPAAPFVLMGWEKLAGKKETKILLAILIVPILLFTWNFLLNNLSPIANWAPYL